MVETHQSQVTSVLYQSLATTLLLMLTLSDSRWKPCSMRSKCSESNEKRSLPYVLHDEIFYYMLTDPWNMNPPLVHPPRKYGKFLWFVTVVHSIFMSQTMFPHRFICSSS